MKNPTLREEIKTLKDRCDLLEAKLAREVVCSQHAISANFERVSRLEGEVRRLRTSLEAFRKTALRVSIGAALIGVSISLIYSTFFS